MFLELPVTALRLVQKAHLSVRIHLHVRADAIGRPILGFVLAHMDGATRGSGMLPDARHLRQEDWLSCLAFVLEDNAEDVRGRHVVISCFDDRTIDAFRTSTRGGRPVDGDVARLLDRVHETCRLLDTTLTVTRLHDTRTEEDAILSILAEFLCDNRRSSMPGTESSRHVGTGWQEAMFLGLEEEFPSRDRRAWLNRKVVSERIGRGLAPLYLEFKAASALSFGNGEVDFPKAARHLSGQVVEGPDAVVLEARRGDARCEIEWRRDGWRVRATAETPAEPSFDPALPRIACMDDIPISRDDILRSPWAFVVEAVLASARNLAAASAATGRSFEGAGAPMDFVGWIEGMPETRADTAYAFADISGSAGDRFGVGAIVVGPRSTAYGLRAHPMEDAVELEAFAAVQALDLVFRTMDHVDRVVVVTDCATTYRRMSHWLAWPRPRRIDGIGHRVVEAAARFPGTIDVVRQKGHTMDVHAMAAGNSLCDRLARVAAVGGGTMEREIATAGWIAAVVDDVRALETEAAVVRRTVPLDMLHLSFMLRRPIVEARRLVVDLGATVDDPRSIAWDDAAMALHAAGRPVPELDIQSPWS